MKHTVAGSATIVALFLIVGWNAVAKEPERVFLGGDARAGIVALEAPREHISEAEQQEVWNTIQANIALLTAQGRLAPRKATAIVKFGWPTRSALGRPEFLDHFVANYVDQDPAAGALRDFSCGTRTYDSAGPSGGHKGTDIRLGFLGFYKQDTEQVVVVAAAAGTIVAKDDTQFDRSCGNLSSLFSNPALRNNVISIRHADGSVAIYYHMKTGSLTVKHIGDEVAEGEYLGVVGSSGFSAAPHLHFEVRTAGSAVIDPWFGECNPAQTESWWKDQQPYIMKEILALMPSSQLPGTANNLSAACTNNVAANEPASHYVQPNFYAQPDVTHFLIAFLRDIQTGDPITLTVNRPDGSQHSTFSFNAASSAATTYAFMSRTIAASEPAGRWMFEVTYGGKTRSVPFYFNVPAPAAARVYEFFHAGLNHYFRTAVKEEADSLTPATGFLPTGDDYFALDRAVSGAGVMPVCRFYGSVNPGPNSHFYTADPAECQALKDIQASTPASEPRWNYEETAFAAYLPVGGVCPPEAPFPIYRLYNRHFGEIVAGVREDSNHRFTTLSSVYYNLALQGWSGEGVVMCAGSKP